MPRGYPRTPQGRRNQREGTRAAAVRRPWRMPMGRTSAEVVQRAQANREARAEPDPSTWPALPAPRAMTAPVGAIRHERRGCEVCEPSGTWRLLRPAEYREACAACRYVLEAIHVGPPWTPEALRARDARRA